MTLFDKPKQIALILKHILSLENYEEAFLEAYEAFLNTSNTQTILNALLIKELKHQRYDRVDFLLGRGANINYRFNPNMTLPVYLRYVLVLTSHIKNICRVFLTSTKLKN